MKRKNAMLLSLLSAFALLLFLSGCEQEKDSADDAASGEDLAAISVEELCAILADLETSGAELISYSGETAESYRADEAIRAGNYLEELRGYRLESYTPKESWELREEALGYRLVAPDVTLSQYRFGSDYLLCAENKTGEGWFIMPTIAEGEMDADEQYGWMLVNTLGGWYNEARTAALCASGAAALSADELSWFENYTASECIVYTGETNEYFTSASPVSGFFTSVYDDVRDLDATEFIAYFPAEGEVRNADGEEARLVAERADWRGGEDGHLFSVDELPVPCHRISRQKLDAVLTQYAGVTVAEMHTDWMEELFYLPETDCFYTFTSDYGPGVFFPAYGEQTGDLVTLFREPDVDGGEVMTLKLQSVEDTWQILSHAPERLT